MAEGTGSRADKSTDDDRIRIPTSGPDVVACRPRFRFDSRVNLTDATRTNTESPVWIFRCFESKYSRRAGSKVADEGKYLAGTLIWEKKTSRTSQAVLVHKFHRTPEYFAHEGPEDQQSELGLVGRSTI